MASRRGCNSGMASRSSSDWANYEGWARESYKVATTKVYPVTLFRRAKPVPTYYSMVLRESEARLALAGYRLGEGLNALLK